MTAAASAVGLAAAAAAGACLAWPAPADARRRLQRLLPQPAGGSTGAAAGGEPPAVRRPLLVAGGLAVAAAVVAGLPWWAGLAMAAGLVPVVRRHRRPADYPELPLVLDLLASCLAAGAPWAAALTAAAAGAGPQLRRRLEPVIAELHDGAAPVEVWEPWLADRQLAAVARSCRRAAGSGAAAASELTRFATRIRARHRAAVQERSARASVWIVLPLGVCFLPAFVLVGVVPLAYGLLRNVL